MEISSTVKRADRIRYFLILPLWIAHRLTLDMPFERLEGKVFSIYGVLNSNLRTEEGSRSYRRKKINFPFSYIFSSSQLNGLAPWVESRRSGGDLSRGLRIQRNMWTRPDYMGAVFDSNWKSFSIGTNQFRSRIIGVCSFSSSSSYPKLLKKSQETPPSLSLSPSFSRYGVNFWLT